MSDLAAAEYVLKREFLCGVTDREVNSTVDGICRDLVSALVRAGMLADPDAIGDDDEPFLLG